jgi:hypothetical protein
MKQVSSDDWAIALCHDKIYATERSKETLDHVSSVTGEHLGKVVYSGGYKEIKNYFIDEKAIATHVEAIKPKA